MFRAGGIGRELSWLLSVAAIPLLGSLVFGPAEFITKRYHRRFFTPPGDVASNLLKSLHHSHTFHVTADVVRAAVRSSAARLGPVNSAYLLPRLSEVGCPVLVLWGEQDRFFPVQQLEGVRNTCPLVEIRIFSDVGHWPYAEVPEAFNATVLDFLEHRANG